MIPADIQRFVTRKFEAADRDEALALLHAATIHDGSAAEPRLLRCAAVASGGSIAHLRKHVERLKRDYRDVIVAGEYVSDGGRLVRVRNLSEPIADDA